MAMILLVVGEVSRAQRHAVQSRLHRTGSVTIARISSDDLRMPEECALQGEEVAQWLTETLQGKGYAPSDITGILADAEWGDYALEHKLNQVPRSYLPRLRLFDIVRGTGKSARFDDVRPS